MKYYDQNGKELTLDQMASLVWLNITLRNEPKWAADQIKQCEKMKTALKAYQDNDTECNRDKTSQEGK